MEKDVGTILEFTNDDFVPIESVAPHTNEVLLRGALSSTVLIIETAFPVRNFLLENPFLVLHCTQEWYVINFVKLFVV